jgi:hypothetical protein
MQSLTVTKHEIAQLGGPSADQLSRQAARARLEAHGFPSPLGGIKRPLRWSRLAVEAWLNGVRDAHPAEPIDTEGALLAARLAARSRAIALREEG